MSKFWGEVRSHYRRAWRVQSSMCYREQIPFPQLSPGLTLWTHRSITSCSFSPFLSLLQICLVENSVGTEIYRVYKAPRSLYWEGPLNSYLFNSHFFSFPTNLVFRILYRIPAPFLQTNNQASFDLFNHIPAKGHVPVMSGIFLLPFSWWCLSLGQDRELEEATGHRAWLPRRSGSPYKTSRSCFLGWGKQAIGLWLV